MKNRNGELKTAVIPCVFRKSGHHAATPELEIARPICRGPIATPAEAERYTRWLAAHHTKISTLYRGLLPRHLHSISTMFMRTAAGRMIWETKWPIRPRALQLLDAWENELRLIYADGRGPAHPVLIALRETIRAKDFRCNRFAICCARFRQDQTVQRYSTWDEVLDYCVYFGESSRQTGPLLCGYRDEIEGKKLSDFTCTALQAGGISCRWFRATWKRAASYIPLEALAAHGLKRR